MNEEDGERGQVVNEGEFSVVDPNERRAVCDNLIGRCDAGFRKLAGPQA
ncbi:MAG TPA: hypothetical protein VFV18_02895 [Porticoccaceae bacterium]|nr:hypothetical protein [Porticoccaceae bacterium]